MQSAAYHYPIGASIYRTKCQSRAFADSHETHHGWRLYEPLASIYRRWLKTVGNVNARNIDEATRNLPRMKG